MVASAQHHLPLVRHLWGFLEDLLQDWGGPCVLMFLTEQLCSISFEGDYLCL
jgi:hypothetical protein